MKRLLVLVALVAVLFSVSAGVASSKLPIFGTADSCASVFTEDANACGGGSPVVIASWWGDGGWWCVWTYRGTTNWWVARCY